MNRSKVSKGKSRRIFRKTASKTHPLNMANTLVQRGGIHLAIAIAIGLVATVFCGCKFYMKDASVGELSAETKGIN